MPEDESANRSQGMNGGDDSASDPQLESQSKGETAAHSREPSQNPQDPLVDPMAERRKKAPTVDRTKLDVDAVREMAAKTVADHEEKLREELEARPAEPPKEFHPVTNHRMAAPCSSVCKTTEKAEKVSFCDRCHLRVYDFSDIEQPEAEELIFKMEGRRNVVLFKRPDGKFLTSNCPVGARRHLTNRAAAALGAATIIAIIALFLTQAPPQPNSVANPASNSNQISAERLEELLKRQKSKKQTTTAPAISPSPASPRKIATDPNLISTVELSKRLATLEQSNTADSPLLTSPVQAPTVPNIVSPHELERRLRMAEHGNTPVEEPQPLKQESAAAPTAAAGVNTAAPLGNPASLPATPSGQSPQTPSQPASTPVQASPATQVNPGQSPGNRVAPTPAPSASPSTEVPATAPGQQGTSQSSTQQNANPYVKNYR